MMDKGLRWFRVLCGVASRRPRAITVCNGWMVLFLHFISEASTARSSLCLDLVAVGLVLWDKVEVLVCWAEEHFTAMMS